ncbi:MAG: patatin-like phospholipase family protein, partial [Candidatus Thiodiazotropha sp.]
LDIETGLNRRILIADRTQRREEILKTIAEGCHAAMQAMLPVALKELANNNPSARISCSDVFDIYQQNYSNTKLGKSVIERLPGSDEREDCPPGLKEICKYCTKELKWNQQEVSLPDWPHELLGNSGPTSYFKNDNTNNNNDLDSKNSIIKALGNYWATPSAADIAARSSDATASALNTSDTREALRRPTVSLLFSGGVFRGVFQIGVVNALHELGVKPDIVAGSSVGSIMAAIAANILVTKHGATEKSTEKYESALKLARLAASFLAIDRLILTDQFADFVREFTLRAATTNFSLYKADRLFRKYDQPLTTNFDHGAREVVAGIERLFYINFYQLNVLVRAIRQRNHKRIVRCVKDFAQQWLDRMSVGEEMLGAQPLEALIDHFVGESAWGSKKVAATDQACLKGCFHEFLANGVIFLSTTTELHEGRLLTLGSPFGGYGNISKMDLAQALLASSAFPSVFRARSMSDLFPIASRSEQFIDGGVMDNLPIDAVVQLLEEVSDKALNTPLILRRPYYGTTDTQVPHLVFAASLQPHVGPIEKLSHLHVVESNWMQLRKRVKKLSYNHKLKLYEQASAEIGTLYKHWFKQTPTDKDSPVLDLEVASLIPNWLCGTFAFHPMLGYRRERQAQSIAHGCAMTLLKLRNYKDTCLKAWGIDPHELPHAKNLEEAETTTVYPAAIKAGKCWLRPEIDCPFSKQSLYRLNLKVTDCGRKLEGNTITELAKIHIACCDPKTHRP